MRECDGVKDIQMDMITNQYNWSESFGHVAAATFLLSDQVTRVQSPVSARCSSLRYESDGMAGTVPLPLHIRRQIIIPSNAF